MAIQLSRIDHHKVLGVDPSASPAEIEDAYRSLSARYRDQPWQFERARAVDRAYQSLTGTRPARVPVSDRHRSQIDDAPLIARDSPQVEEAQHYPRTVYDSHRNDAAPIIPFTDPEPIYHDDTAPEYVAEPAYVAETQHVSERHYDDEPVVAPVRATTRERDLVEADDGDDERSGRRAFYVIGALALAGIVGVVAFPMVDRNSDPASTEQVAADAPQDLPADAATGSPAIASTDQVEGVGSAANQAAPTDLAANLGILPPPRDGEVRIAQNDLPDEVAPGNPASAAAATTQRQEEAAVRTAAAELAAERREERASAREDSPPPAAPLERADARPAAPTPRPVSAPSRAARAQWVRGGLVDSDNRGGQFEGAVSVRLNVSPSGRASSCQVARSSGNPSLDATTCRLLVDRLEFVPARNAAGNPISTEVTSTHVWARSNRR